MSKCQYCGDPQPGDATLCADCLDKSVNKTAKHGHELLSPLRYKGDQL